MSIKITATSTCDLPAELLEQYQITMAPLYVSFGGNTYKDGLDASPEDIFRHVEDGGQLPTTAAVNIADYQKLFAELSPKYDSVLHITIGSEFSCCYQNALVAAEEFSNVYVVDSRNLTVGQGILAIEAAEAARRGDSVEDILAMLEQMAGQVDTTFVVDKLDYLAKGGRCSSVVALGANLLKLKPCIVLADGKMTVGKKYRGAFEKVLSDYGAPRKFLRPYAIWCGSLVSARCSLRWLGAPSPVIAVPTPWALSSSESDKSRPNMDFSKTA